MCGNFTDPDSSGDTGGGERDGWERGVGRKGGGGGEEGTHCREVRRKKFGTLHEFACHPCAGAMLIFSVSFQF